MYLATPHRKVQPVQSTCLAEGLDQPENRDRTLLVHELLTPVLAFSSTSATFQLGPRPDSWPQTPVLSPDIGTSSPQWTRRILPITYAESIYLHNRNILQICK